MDDYTKPASLEITMKILEKMYDVVRMVDPIAKKIIIYSGKEGIKEDLSASECFDSLHKGKACQNCISARALDENSSIVKIEYVDNQVFMVNAFPVEHEGQRVVFEMFKNITDCGIIEIKSGTNDSGKLERVINRRNEAIVRDDLTNTYNKRYIYETLPYEIVKGAAHKTPLTVLMVDIDDFKIINDTYGHMAGDYVLKGFAKILKSYTRKEKDWVARFGGDEFLVVLGETDTVDGHHIAERMRQKVAATTITYGDQSIRCTGSFGGCTILSAGMSSEKLIECADQQLYQSKKEGRNKVSFGNM